VRQRAAGYAAGYAAGRSAVDRFSFFFGFYGLILGLAVTELLNGLGKLVRAGALRKLGWQTGLLALFLLLVIIATWIDAWESLRGVTLDIAGLWAPALVASIYHLTATIVFPEHPAEWPSLDDYFAKRRRRRRAIRRSSGTGSCPATSPSSWSSWSSSSRAASASTSRRSWR
jgi:hypothetical protein